MIRECNENDRQLLTDYLKNEPYGKAILEAVNAYGFDSAGQTVYIDMPAAQENGGNTGIPKGVYLWIYRNLLLYSADNQINIDFLEQMTGAVSPDLVVGRKDNVNIVSWLLTDYQTETADNIPVLKDKNGKSIECFVSEEFRGEEWEILKR